MGQSPAALGYHAVAEWERNRACVTAWPAHQYAWGEFLAEAQREFQSFCRELAADEGAEAIELLVDSEEHEREARLALEELGARVRFQRMPYGDVWLRDTSPIVLGGERGQCSVRFGFNGWGEKYRYPGDAELSERLAQDWALPVFSFESVLEGGAVELDGQGTCLTTRSCLLNENRGSAPQAAQETLLGEAFGVTQTLWLDDGLQGDHTDGHIDNLARFVAPGVVVHMRPSGADDPNATTLRAIEATLGGFHDARGRKLELVAIPSPGRVLDQDGAPMAASYMNFYLGNRAVIVPAFDSDFDEPARRALEPLFAGRRVVSCRARAILEGGGGTFHCMTRQVPA